MSAIITPTFRRNSVTDFKAGIDDVANNYYIGIGRLIPWPNSGGYSEENQLFSEPLPQVTLAEEKDVLDELMTLVKIDEHSIMIPKNQWSANRRYKRYDPTDPLTFELEGNIYPSVVVSDNKIYLCIENNAQNASIGESTFEPHVDNITFQAGNQKVGDDRGDGYVWAFLGALSNTSKLNNDQFITVPSLLTSPTDITAAETATGGLVYGFKIEETPSNLNLADLDIVLEGIDSAGSKIADVNIISAGTIDSRFLVDGLVVSNRVDSIKYNNNDFGTAPAGYAKASVIAYDLSGSTRTKIDGLKIIPLLAPLEGFGYDAAVTTPAHYAGVHARFAESVDGEALTSVAYRQISIIKNPQRRTDQSPDDIDNVEASLRYSDEEAIDCLDYIQLAGSDQNLTGFDAGTIMEQAVSGARAAIVHVDLGAKKIYFQQQDQFDTNFLPFDTTNDITVNSPSPVTLDGADITSIESSEYIHNTGEVLFVDNRRRINRNADQIEDLRIVIQF